MRRCCRWPDHRGSGAAPGIEGGRPVSGKASIRPISRRFLPGLRGRSTCRPDNLKWRCIKPAQPGGKLVVCRLPSMQGDRQEQIPQFQHGKGPQNFQVWIIGGETSQILDGKHAVHSLRSTRIGDRRFSPDSPDIVERNGVVLLELDPGLFPGQAAKLVHQAIELVRLHCFSHD